MTEKLIQPNGKPRIGLFDQPMDLINVEEADVRTPMNHKASPLRRHFGYKRFQYLGGISDSLIFGCALADLRYLSAIFFYVYSPQQKKLKSWQYKTPLAFGLTMGDSPTEGESTFNLGKTQISMGYQSTPDSRIRLKTLSIQAGNELSLQTTLEEPADYKTLNICTPAGARGWVYAQKTAGTPLTGKLDCELGQFDLAEIGAYGHHDFSAGFMRRETFWNWACTSGLNEHGQAIGLNLSWGVNETGFSENCCWVDNQLHLLPPCQFEFDQDDDTSLWRIRSSCNRVDLTFQPEGQHKEYLNAFILATNFRQIFGTFQGTIQAGGQQLSLDGLYGFVEDQYTKW